jgi:hypothetical protein
VNGVVVEGVRTLGAGTGVASATVVPAGDPTAAIRRGYRGRGYYRRGDGRRGYRGDSIRVYFGGYGPYGGYYGGYGYPYYLRYSRRYTRPAIETPKSYGH